MAASEPVGRASARPQIVAAPLGGLKSALLAAAVLAVFLYFFPLFRVVSLKTRTAAAATATAAAPAAFDPVTAAAKFWKTDLPPAISRAVELEALAPAIRANAETAKTKYAPAAGLGTAYYFVRGSGKVVARERNTLRLALHDASSAIVTLRIGPVFGNTVRDGSGLLDVNSFPGLQEFNALSASLNSLVEKNVLPLLREQAVVGATVHFVGCAEAPESAAAASEPLLMIVPVQAEVR
jgi:predicted lipoprotein